ncbi:MAG: hypothetical protein OEO77_11700 [Acidimicrobiia bacterium]|nr:hypothetical protein [Acidimicrobiia bacterium]
MRNRIVSVFATAALAVGLMAAPALAAPRTPDTDCLRAGQAVLRDLGAFSAAARGQVDYSAFADEVNGPIFADLPEGSFLPINVVFQLHLDSPELFAWCD